MLMVLNLECIELAIYSLSLSHSLTLSLTLSFTPSLTPHWRTHTRTRACALHLPLPPIGGAGRGTGRKSIGGTGRRLSGRFSIGGGGTPVPSLGRYI